MRTRFGPDDGEAFDATRDALLESYRTAVEGSDDAADGFVASMMLEYKWGYGDGHITEWRCADVEDLLLGYFPHKVALDDEDLLRVAPDIADFLGFLDRRGLLSGDPLADLQATARGLAPEFIDAMTDPAHYGMAKGLLDQMRAEGVDPSDESDVQRWLDDFNSRPFEERDAILAGPDTGPRALPPVELPSNDDLERAASESAILARLGAFAEYVGDGRKLTQQGYLTLADGKALVASLETGDRVDERIGDRVFRTRSTAELPKLDLIFRWARAAGFVKVQHGRVSATRRGRAIGSRSLEDWGAAFDGLLKLESSGRRRDRPYGLGWDEAIGWLVERLPAWLYEGPGLELEALKDAVWGTVEVEYVVSSEPVIRESQQRLVGSAVDRIVDRFVELGAVVVTDGTMSLTPLGLWGTNRLLRARGEIAPVVGELAGSSAAELVSATAKMPLDAAEGEIRSWVEARPGSAVAELVEAARSGADPMMALHALTFSGPKAEAEVRAMLEVPELRPQAQMWLVGNGFDDAASLSPEMLQSLIIETLAIQVDADGPVAAVAHFQGLGTEDEQIRMIDDLLRAEHARTSEILELIGRHHPARAVAKAARKTAFKRQAFNSS